MDISRCSFATENKKKKGEVAERTAARTTVLLDNVPSQIAVLAEEVRGLCRTVNIRIN